MALPQGVIDFLTTRAQKRGRATGRQDLFKMGGYSFALVYSSPCVNRRRESRPGGDVTPQLSAPTIER